MGKDVIQRLRIIMAKEANHGTMYTKLTKPNGPPDEGRATWGYKVTQNPRRPVNPGVGRAKEIISHSGSKLDRDRVTPNPIVRVSRNMNVEDVPYYICVLHGEVIVKMPLLVIEVVSDSAS
ncbi:hypothetical protein ACS0TY_003562 [Phlomoides rotata]